MVGLRQRHRPIIGGFGLSVVLSLLAEHTLAKGRSERKRDPPGRFGNRRKGDKEREQDESGTPHFLICE